MAPVKFPRRKIRSALRGHALKRLEHSVDALIFLDFVVFLEEFVRRSVYNRLLTEPRLMKNAERISNENGERRMSARDIRKATRVFPPGSGFEEGLTASRRV
jgi:hypothetical protein